MIIDDSDSPSSIETLDESSSPIASLGAHVVQSLSLDDVQPSIPALEVSTPLDETLTVPSLVSLDHDVSRMQQAPDELDEPFLDICSSDNQKQWTPNVSTPKTIVNEPSCVGAGLTNLGNTCFLNSVLQCLTHSCPLVERLFSYRAQDPCNCGNVKFCVLSALRDHILTVLTTSERCWAPSVFVDNLKYFSADFKRYQEEDAQEFLQAFLDKLEKCCSDLVQHIFGGSLYNGLDCCNCYSFSWSYENGIGLSLEIGDADDLERALDSFFCVEEVEMTCDKCNKNVSKKKKILLDELQEIVTFQLKRFKSNGFTMEKISDHVAFPLEIDLQPYMCPPEPNKKVNTKYNLYAFVEHIGSLASGHYCSYVKSAPKIWHRFSDEQVDRIDENTALSQNAYILFYAREGKRWFSSWRALQNPSPNSVLDPTSGECSYESSYENPCKLFDDSAGTERAAATCDDDMVQDQDSSQKQQLCLVHLYLQRELSNYTSRSRKPQRIKKRTKLCDRSWSYVHWSSFDSIQETRESFKFADSKRNPLDSSGNFGVEQAIGCYDTPV